MDRVRKTYFNPLATTKESIRELLEALPVGSAHPFSPERILLLRTNDGIDEIDISSYPEDFFFNAVDLGEMGEILLRRMAGFSQHLSVFNDFQIVQAPASTFRIPIVSGEIAMLAVSVRDPTYYDFCFADKDCNACCWLARDTFPGITHSGDILNGQDLLDYIRIDGRKLTQKEICFFISGYQKTKITRFLGTHPAVLLADHVDKILYIVPVPLDSATIGDATICCPLVMKKDGDDGLICSILPTATTDRDMMCHADTMKSPCFAEALTRADFTLSAPQLTATPAATVTPVQQSTATNSELLSKITAKDSAVLVTSPVTLPSVVDPAKTQVINFGTGLEFKLDGATSTNTTSSSVVLPCIFGTQLQGPMLLATGTVPSNVPSLDEKSLREYYERLKDITVIVDDKMTDNARNLATSLRLNAVFIVQLSPEQQPKTTDEIMSLLDSTNINSVTALAGPQSLILVQVADKYYFYRGIANQAHLNTTKMPFGADVTAIIESLLGTGSLIEPRAKRIVDLSEPNSIVLPASGQQVRPEELKEVLDKLQVEQVKNLEDDISAAVPQLQMLLNQKDLSELSQSLVTALSTKVSAVAAPMRKVYIKFLTQEYDESNPEAVKTKGRMLGELRKTTMDMQKALEPVISSLHNLISTQTTSKRTHDLKRLLRQAQIKGNVEATKTMTFETMAGYLENYAADMGVMVMNIETGPFQRVLANLTGQTMATIDASECCDLDSRVLHLDGFDAGIIIEQSQAQHNGPLRSTNGPGQPILAVPYLNQGRGYEGSMLAWVCWDEFVNLKSPYTVRWMEKCNDAHIAALRILTRSTLSQAVLSREFNIEAGAPETGHLMSALLVEAMTKLAAMRTTAPTLVEKAEDTTTKLMRGLFGNLLTVAGSGVRPLSMVWQLFGLNPSYDIPTTEADWIWYEKVVQLYPYTGWPLSQFHTNVEKLLDKAIVRLITKSENTSQITTAYVHELARMCKLRNIQLEHSRTIITIFMRMLTSGPEEGIDIQAVAARLLSHLPAKLERQTGSYGKMISYLNHLASGAARIAKEDLVLASVYTKRSAAYASLKQAVSAACVDRNWAEVKTTCQALIDEHTKTAALWGVDPAKLNIQNLKVYRDLLAAELGDSEEVSEDTFRKNLELTRRVLGDAETKRVPWQIGKEGEWGPKIEPIGEAFVREMLTGEAEKKELDDVEMEDVPATASTAVVEAKKTVDEEILEFKGTLQASFVKDVQRPLTAKDVCAMIKVPERTMRVFVQALNPQFEWEAMGENFKIVVLGLLKDRSNRAESRPVLKLLDL
ncbi:hypothetical protein QBC37DRAFT_425840 [Rhypophila decipiens]|uniref:Uncharacterized protein n=1 Tax=Rhypophila decipiens TaxID=261697 RepID=A0AAN6Y677_9PEZI|nr:hypothetical protein QBC37DRAFT_425840 [Rhypophila decipiens]